MLVDRQFACDFIAHLTTIIEKGDIHPEAAGYLIALLQGALVNQAWETWNKKKREGR